MNWLKRLFSRQRLYGHLSAEIQAHIAEKVEELMAGGMSREEANFAARREFGNLLQIEERSREVWQWLSLENLFRDVRYGMRMLARKPAFAVLVIATLGLGIGANTATFSIVDAVLLRPLPYRDPERLVVIWQAQPGRFGQSESFNSYGDFENWRKSSRSFEQLEALTWATAGQTLTWRGKPQRTLAIPATAGIFSLLGVPAAMGRTFQDDDLKRGCTVVLAHSFWQNQLGAAPDIVGGALNLDGKPCTVAGVMPEGFDFYPRQTNLWTLITPNSEYVLHPLDSVVGVFGRLKPGLTPAAAQAELAVLHQQLMRDVPASSWVTNFVPVVYDLQSEFTWLAGRNLRTGLLALFVAVTLVLLIACLNVVNLMLGRAADRTREFAVRAALGSGRVRLVRQLLTECLLLSILGASLGVALAVGGVAYFRAVNPVELPPGNTVTVNFQVLAFTAVLAILTGLLFGIAPAWKGSRADVNEVLKQAGRGGALGRSGHRTGKLLVVAEAALSLVLLAGAGLLIRSIARLSSVSLGINPHHLLTAEIDLPQPGYSDAARQANFYRRLVSKLAALPGVEGAALSSWQPPYPDPSEVLTVEGRPAPVANSLGDVRVRRVSPELFRVMEIPLLRGRPFDLRDRKQSQPVAIVSEGLVKEYFPHEDPIGRQVKLGAPAEAAKASWLTIVGVVGDVKATTVFKEMGYVDMPAIYQPVDQVAGGSMGMVIRTGGKPGDLQPTVERTVADLDKDVPVSNFLAMDDRLAEFLAQPRFRTVVLGAFAGLALLLAAIGIFGVLSQSVSQRTHELGIRMALGAERGQVLWLIVRQGMSLAIAGTGIGLLAALAADRLLAAMLYGVKPTDPMTMASVCLVLVAVALLASYIPARRATKVDPVVALRYE
jgi:putative ABC transport system permease protein